MTGIASLHPLQAAEGFDVKKAFVFPLILCSLYYEFPPPLLKVVKTQGRLEMELHGFDFEIVEAVEK